jgi:hypothetical protein
LPRFVGCHPGVVAGLEVVDEIGEPVLRERLILQRQSGKVVDVDAEDACQRRLQTVGAAVGDELAGGQRRSGGPQLVAVAVGRGIDGYRLESAGGTGDLPVAPNPRDLSDTGVRCAGRQERNLR